MQSGSHFQVAELRLPKSHFPGQGQGDSGDPLLMANGVRVLDGHGRLKHFNDWIHAVLLTGA
jgi:hypothetical protein